MGFRNVRPFNILFGFNYVSLMLIVYPDFDFFYAVPSWW